MMENGEMKGWKGEGQLLVPRKQFEEQENTKREDIKFFIALKEELDCCCYCFSGSL